MLKLVLGCGLIVVLPTFSVVTLGFTWPGLVGIIAGLLIGFFAAYIMELLHSIKERLDIVYDHVRGVRPSARQ